MMQRIGASARAAAAVGALLSFILLAGCQDKARDSYVDSLTEMEKTEFKGQKIDDKTVEELKKNIEKFQAEVDRKVKATENLGVYWKMLAVRYMNGGMYGESLEALKQAIAVYPENPLLFFYQGTCAARLGKAQTADSARQAELYRLAENAYKRAVALDPVLVHALYALSILYVFELDRPAEAEPLLKKALEVEKKNWDCRMLLARVYYQTRRPEQAVEIYDEVAGSAAPDQLKKDAEANRKRIQEELYGKK